MAATASSWCQKFEPNIFNKAKCQNCFKPKEQHSSAALESSKVSRKISKCGYLFVAPDSFDFSNPMDRSRRWQRRFFVLYDDGELTYSVDENINTIPQGVIDMNQCTDVVDAEEITGHQLSAAIVMAERSTYFKGTTKDETTRWNDVLVMYPRSIKVKARRAPNYVVPKSTAAATTPSEAEDAACDSTGSGAPSGGHGDSGNFNAHGRPNTMALNPRSWRSSERSQSPPPVWNSADPLWQSSQSRSPTSSLLLNGRSKNETDEYKMAKSGDVAAVRPTSGHRLDNAHRESAPDVQYSKKGWLVKQGVTDKDWTKHWFVLNPNFLRYYRDSASEGSNQLDGAIDLSAICRVSEVNVSRNYGFKLETPHGDTVLSAMTSGIRTKWMQALQACLPVYNLATSSATSSLASSPRSSLVDVRRGSGNSVASRVSSLADGGATSRHASSPSSSLLHTSKSLTDSSRASSISSDRTNFTCTWPYKKVESNVSDSSTGSHARHEDGTKTAGNEKKGNYRPTRCPLTGALLRAPYMKKFESRAVSSEPSSDDTDVDAASVNKPRRVIRTHPRDHRSKSLGVPPSRETIDAASGKERSVGNAGRSSKEVVRKESGRRKNSGDLLGKTAAVHPYRAPSAKVKEKSRSKSPRTKSPPPDARKKDGKAKRKEVTDVARPLRGSEGTLVELLENQVGTLKTSLVKAQTELSEMTNTNTELKSQLHLVKQTHHSSLQDMTTADRTQYLAQATGIHDDLYPGGIAEPQQISEFAKLQVQTLKQQLCETQATVRGQHQQIGELRHKLDLTAAALATTEADLTQTVRDLKVERDELRASADDWSGKVERLTKELTERDMLLESKERELRDVTGRLRDAKVQLDVKNDKIESLEVELHDVGGMREELEDKVHQLGDLEHELDVTKQHLREQDEELERSQSRHRATLEERNAEFYAEKERLMERVEQLRSTLVHPGTLDELLRERDETIAQLEEKLIEDAGKVEELSEELTAEMEDNTRLSQELEVAVEEGRKCAEDLAGKRGDEEGGELSRVETELGEVQERIDAIRKENDGLKAALEELRVAVGVMERRYEEEVGKNKELKDELEASQETSVVKEQELETLKGRYDNVLGDLRNKSSELDSLQDQLDENRSASTAELSAKSDEIGQTQKQVVDLRSKLTEAQSELAAFQSLEATPLHIDTDADGLPEEMKTRYHAAVSEIKKLRKKLKDVQISREKLESNNHSLKQELKNMEIGYQDQLNQLSSKVHDLTTKLSVAERRVNRLDRRSSRYSSVGSSSELEGENTAQSSPRDSLVTQANIQEALASIQQGVLMSVVDTSSTCSSVASSVAAESGSAENLTARITRLQTEISTSESKVRELTAKLVHHRQLEVELSVLQRSEASLKVQSQCQKEQIEALNKQLSEKPLEETAARALQCHLREAESKLASTRETLDICRRNLTGIVEELTQEGSEFAYSVRNKLEEIVCVCETKTDICEDSNDRRNMKLFAERLAMEAAILGEMAQTCESDDLLGYGHDLASVQKVNGILLGLEQQLSGVAESGCNGSGKTQGEAIQVYSELLANKIVQQDRMTVLVGSIDANGDDSNEAGAQDDAVKKAARQALSKARSDLQLTHSSDHSGLVVSRGLVQNGLHTVRSQLSDQRAMTCTEDDRRQAAETLWQSTLRALLDRENNALNAIEAYRCQKLVEIGNLFLRKRSGDGSIDNVAAMQVFDRDLLQVEFSSMMSKFVDGYLTDRSSVDDLLREEKERFLSDLTQCCEMADNAEPVRDDSCASLDDEINNALMQLASVLAQKVAVVALVSDVNSQVSSEHADTSTGSPDHKQLVSRLQQTANAKHRVASYLINNNDTVGSTEAPLAEITELAEYLATTYAQLRQHRVLCESYAAAVSQEAAWQAELTYVTARLSQQHANDLQTLTDRRSSNRDEETEELRSMAEERTQELHQKEARFADEVGNMHRHLADTRDQLERTETRFRQEVAALKGGYEIRVRSLQQDLQSAGDDRDRLHAEREAGQAASDATAASLGEELVATRSRLEALQQERAQLERTNEGVIAALKGDIAKTKDQLRSVSADGGGVGHGESLEAEVSRLWKLLEDERRRHAKEVEQLRAKLTGSSDDAAQTMYTSRVQEMQDQIQLMQVDCEQEVELLRASHRRELARSKEEMLELLASAEEKSLRVDEDSIRKKYVKEIDRIKQMYDKGFASMEKSHHKMMMEMRKAHKRELDCLRQEKDQLLNEETKATQSALESMRNAHEAELLAERNKFIDLIAKTYSQADVEVLQHQHEDDLDLIQGEISHISEQYSVKVLECATLEERLDVQTKALHQSRRRVQDLIARNEELNTKLKHEITKLNRMVTNTGANNQGGEGNPPEVNELRVALKVKEAEIHQQQDEIKSWKEQLHDTVEELEDSMEMYHDLYGEHTVTKRRYEKELADLRERLRHAVPPPSSCDEVSSGDEESYDSSCESQQSDPDEPHEEGACAASPPRTPKGTCTARRVQWRQKDKGRAHSSPNLGGSDMFPSTDSLSSSPRASTSAELHLSTEPASPSRHLTIPGSSTVSQGEVQDT